jgi:hypothetical protein
MHPDPLVADKPSKYVCSFAYGGGLLHRTYCRDRTRIEVSASATNIGYLPLSLVVDGLLNVGEENGVGARKIVEMFLVALS